MTKQPSREFFSKIPNALKKLFPKPQYQPDDGLAYWREQIFMRVVVMGVLFIAPLVGILALIAVRLQNWTGLISLCLAYLAGIVSAFFQRISIRYRIIIFLLTLYSFGLFLQIANGPIDNGFVLLFFFTIMSALLLDIDFAVYAMGLNFITFLILGILLISGVLQNSGMSYYSLNRWVGVIIGFIPVNLIATFSISVILTGLAKGIDDSKKSATALQQNEARYRAVVEDQIELIDRWLPDGTLTFVNQAAADFSGIPREELIGMNFFSFLPEEVQAILKERIKTLTPADPVVTMEEAVIVNGRTYWMRWTNRALFNEKGEIQEFQSAGSDITQRKHAEENLERSENRYRAIVESQHEIISRWRPDGSLTFINDAGCRFYGKPVEELLQTSIIDLAPPEEKQKLRDYIALFSIENPGQTVQLSGPDKDGNNHWFEWQDNALIEKGRIVEFQSVGRDITEEKRIRNELLKSEARYRAVVEDQVELICRMLPDGTINFTNHAYARFFGLVPKDLIGSNLADVVGTVEAEELLGHFARLSFQHPTYINTHLETNIDGEDRWFRWTNRGIFDDQGKLVEIQAIGQDIHERKLAEQALQASEARYRSVVEDQLELICRVFPDGTYTFANHAYASFYGSTPDELIGRNVSEVLAADIIKNIDEDHALLTPKDPTRQRTNLTTNAKGEIEWFTWTDLGIFDEEGNLIEIQGIGRNIHEQILAEQALEKSETLYRGIIEDQVELICRTLPDGTLTFVNYAFARFFGKKPEDLIGSNTATIIEPEVTSDLIEKVAHLSPENPVLLNTHLATSGTNKKRWIAWTNRGIFDDQGKLVEIQAIGQDIHDRKLAEQALQESESRYRAVVEDQVEMICRILPGGTYTFVNNAYARFYGKTPEELIGRNVQEIIPPEIAASSIKNSQKLTPEEPLMQKINFETNAKGEKRWFSWTDHGIFNANGNLIEIQAIGRDIHEQILAEQALEKSEARYRAIVENQIEPVCRWQPDFTLTFVNDSYCKLFNKTRDELLGKSFQSSVPDEDWIVIEQMVLDLKTGASSAVAENRLITANGVRWLQWALSAIRDENGAIIEFQSVGHDTSEQKHIQQMLEKTLSDQIKLSKDNSELAERLEGLYLTDVNRHETQLRHLAIELHDDVLNALAVVSTNLDPDGTPKHVIEAYERAIQRTREIVNGLRTAMLNYGLYIGLETLADELSDQMPEGPLVYIDIPQSAIRYDPDVELHLFRIAQEACNNAIKHANASEVHIRGKLDVERVLLEISDNGSGFDAEEILDLPDLLRKEHFGLAGMFERAELIHGELSINASPQEGSRVRVTWHAMPE